ncbi:RNA-binding protein rnp24-like protein [Lasiosphaeria hispida]|uniref:RNA-binding protein rnp24-like protein n=1 Tax=Lasiosphaeria hispida TaxID=260671 RepID=A0AAJ0HPJ3_9PEZI|nr:RNA-binding protein rnp24-like protein [Lasiosphaeria hispida]
MATKDLEATAPNSDVEVTEPTSPLKKRKSTALKEIEVDLTLPEPPSKKIRRAIKKGKPIPTKQNSSDDEGEDGEAKDGAKPSKKKERSPHGVWIGNLRFSVNKAEIRQWLVDNSGGAITDDLITRVHIPTIKPAPGATKKVVFENRGFAYVDFSTLAANVAAIALSETVLHSRKLLIKDSKNFEGRPKKEEADAAAAAAAEEEANKPKKNPITKVFVGNLAFQVTEDDLHAHFEKCGKIRWIKVATFEDTGKCKGYGWVNFEEPDAAAWAVKGFVKVQEKIETLEDFMDEDDKPAATKKGSTKPAAEAGSDAEDATPDTPEQKKKTKKQIAAIEASPVRIKSRKWWVNQLHGRPLKIELAEDDQSRYKKRFRGNGPKHNKPAETNGNYRPGGAAAPPAGADGAAAPEPAKPYLYKQKDKKAIKTATDISVARLTGAPVVSTGKKTMFE